MSSPAHQDEFLKFHADNPNVFARLHTMALYLRRRGFKRWGIRNLWEKLRYDMAIETNTTDFRLNDHYHSHYARLLMESDENLRGFFELRK